DELGTSARFVEGGVIEGKGEARAGSCESVGGTHGRLHTTKWRNASPRMGEALRATLPSLALRGRRTSDRPERTPARTTWEHRRTSWRHHPGELQGAWTMRRRWRQPRLSS